MTEPTTARRPDPMIRFLGGLLIAVGALVFGLCGLCTIAFFVGGLLPHGDKSFLVMALVIGGIPTGVGFLLLRFGIAMSRSSSPPNAPGAPGDGQAR
jgi:CHASE2 domain-containing sensor protein